jgi:hypothetical protein
MGQFERTLIIADKGADLHYVEGCTAPIYSKDSLHAAVVEIFVEEGAKVRYSTVQNWSKNILNLTTKRAKAEAHAAMEWIDGNVGSHISMKYPACILAGEYARGMTISVAVAGSNQILACDACAEGKAAAAGFQIFADGSIASSCAGGIQVLDSIVQRSLICVVQNVVGLYSHVIQSVSADGITDSQIVSVKIPTEGRALVFDDVVARVSDSYALAMHLDTDEANAAAIPGSCMGIILD